MISSIRVKDDLHFLLKIHFVLSQLFFSYNYLLMMSKKIIKKTFFEIAKWENVFKLVLLNGK